MTSPNSASASTAVICRPAARARRIKVSAWRHFSWNKTVAGICALLGLEPGLREIQQRARHPRPRARPERGRHRDLAIRNLAQRAAVLARHPNRVLALFRKTGPIDDQHAVAFGQHREETPPDPIGVPGRVRDEMLKGLVGDRLRDAGHHGLHRLPIAVAEEAMHVGPQRQSLRAMAKAAMERFEPADQMLNMRRRGPGDQRPSAYRSHAIRTRSSPLFTKTFRNKPPDLTKSY